MAGQSVTKVLVANRGEIARRVISTCRRMGIATVAVHSDADARAPFAADADEAVAIGGVTAAESYLETEKVLDAARRTGVDAVHPGYGFLAENAGFARAVADAGLSWIGPPPEAIEAMGSKVEARRLMAGSGVPVVPGAELDGAGDPSQIAEQIGFPLMVKASAGGGGKGMRTVATAAELENALEGARREAESSFGDPTVFIERAIQKPRHVEIQIFADTFGNTVSLFERECSIQRRHQKVVEEAPSPALDSELRHRMGDAAVTAAEAVGYVGAGTVEFLLGDDGQFFFLEMNTRLQVEHPVTELITGLDLVELQIAVARGEALPVAALEPTITGHAIEVRLYAEDPASDYLPQTGSVERIAFEGALPFASPDVPGRPGLGPIRLDSGVEDGSEVTPHYDPMLAKVIAWAPTRHEAAEKLAAALERCAVHGVVTNRDFLARTLRHPEFLAGETDTAFLERNPEVAEAGADEQTIRAHALAAALSGMARRQGSGPWSFAPAGWRNNFSRPQHVTFVAGEREVEVDYALRRHGLEAAVNGEDVDAVLVDADVRSAVDASVVLALGGVSRRYRVHNVGDTAYVNAADGQTALVEQPRYPSAEDILPEGSLVAPMPGKILRLAVSEGTEVEQGQRIAVLEAMKMEHELAAPASGTITELHVAEGDQLEPGAPIATIE